MDLPKHTTIRQSGRRRSAGFTLVEILIVVVILGILGAIVLGQISTPLEDSRKNTFASNLNQFAKQLELYHARESDWPSDGGTGNLPAELVGYIDEANFESGTPIGGQWDVEYNELGVLSAVGVHFDSTDGRKDDAYMVTIDAAIDDGDVTTGGFRRIDTNRYYMVMAD